LRGRGNERATVSGGERRREEREGEREEGAIDRSLSLLSLALLFGSRALVPVVERGVIRRMQRRPVLPRRGLQRDRGESRIKRRARSQS
jgi:hypothetical protein